jgi:hypothetical protein
MTGTYTFTLTGVLDSLTSASTSFSVTVSSKCAGQTITASTIATANYQITGTALTTPLTSFTLGGSGSCTAITYTLTQSDGVTAIDSSIFTFSSSAMTLVTSTSSTAKIATYSFLLTGTYTGDTISTTTTFSVIIHSKCYGQSLSANTISGISYNLAASSLSSSLGAFTINGGSTCTGITYALTLSDGVTAIDSSVFTYTAASNTIATSTSTVGKIGTYTFMLTGTLTGDTMTATTTFSITVNSQCYG